MIIGLTGGIASGKSTVSDYLKDKGYPIVDADVISREVVEVGKIGLERISEKFGTDVLNDDGSLNRKALRNIIFSDEQARLDLNSILHPIIHDEILTQLKNYVDKGNDIIIFDAPLLLENNLQDLVDEVWVVSTSYKIQIDRIMKRDGISEKDSRDIISKQMPLYVKEKLADLILYNNGDINNLYEQVENALKTIKIKSPNG